MQQEGQQLLKGSVADLIKGIRGGAETPLLELERRLADVRDTLAEGLDGHTRWGSERALANELEKILEGRR